MSKLALGQSRLDQSQTSKDLEFYSHFWTLKESRWLQGTPFGTRYAHFFLPLTYLIISLIVAFTLNSHIVNEGVL